MILFVGLGNPGKNYQLNRHNIGFMAVDAIARDFSFGPFKNASMVSFPKAKSVATKSLS